MEIWKSQKRGFPHFHRLGGYDDKNEVPNPKNRTESVKYVPGLKCKTCPRLDTVTTKKLAKKSSCTTSNAFAGFLRRAPRLWSRVGIPRSARDFKATNLLLHRNPKRLHLPVKMASFQPQHFRRPRDVPVIFIQLFQNVITLIRGPRLMQG